MPIFSPQAHSVFTPTASAFPTLSSGEVHVWLASLEVSRDQLRVYASYMDRIENARIDRFSIQEAKTNYICTRGLLKELLGHYMALDPRSISFEYGPLGKPYFRSRVHNSIQFNSTDSKQQAVFAFCLDHELGVDIELNSRKVRHSLIAPRKLTLQELDFYRSSPLQLKKQVFLSLWTRKEAYGKALGVGIRYPLNSVNLIGENGLGDTVVTDDDKVDWQIKQLMLADEVIACIVTRGLDCNFRCFRYTESIFEDSVKRNNIQF